MKKKVILSILALFVVSVFIIKVSAATEIPVDFLVDAKAPTTIPANNSTVYATTTQAFDFSAVVFKDTAGADVEGKNDLRKIIVGNIDKSKITAMTGLDLDEVFTNWFTAFCLDASRKYPFGIVGGESYEEHGANGEVDLQVNDILSIALANESSLRTQMDEVRSFLGNNYTVDPVFSYSLPDGQDADAFVTAFESGTEVTANVVSVDFETLLTKKRVYIVSNDTEKQRILDEIELYNSGVADSEKINVSSDVKFLYFTTNHNAASYPLEVKLADVAFQQYVAKDDTSINSYAHALWIVEHTYPTLPLNTALEKAGTSLADLKTQINTLLGGGINDEELEDLAEAYAFGTIQYAIWQVTGYEVNGHTLAVGSLDTPVVNVDALNKLYAYLTTATVPANYTKPETYSNTITITSPAAGKELKETKNDMYYYGPFKATYNALVETDAKMQISITNEDKTGLKVVDADYNEITEVAKNQEFYIQVSKTAKVGNVSARLSLADVETFNPSSNRGRVYYPIYPLGQNAMSGGKITNVTITGDLDVITNSKTGVQNVALLLMVTLVAFTLGYLVLSYKSKPVTLD